MLNMIPFKILKEIVSNPIKPYQTTYLTCNELEGIMSKLGLTLKADNPYINKVFRDKSLIPSGELISPLKRGPKPKDIHNAWFDRFSSVEEYSHLAPWVDDVLYGAGRASTNGSTVSPKFLFHLLKCLPILTVKEIQDHINRKRNVTTGDVIIADSYCRFLLSACHSAIKSLDMHLPRSTGFKRLEKDTEAFSIRSDAIQWLDEKRKLDSSNCYPQTQEELVNKLSQAGLSAFEIAQYLSKRG